MDFKDIANQKIVINCQTICEAEQFVELSLNEGYKWTYGFDVAVDFGFYKSDTCYRIIGNSIVSCNCLTYQRNNYKIIKFTDFIKEDFETMNGLKGVYMHTDINDSRLLLLQSLPASIRSTEDFYEISIETNKIKDEIKELSRRMRYQNRFVLPQITKVEVKNDTVVIVTFSDNTTEKAITSPEDTFSLEQGISICFTKKLLSMLSSGNGSSLYNKIVHKALKLYNDEQAEAAQKEELKQIKIDRAERLAAKRAKRKAKYEAKKREREISVQAEAYARALRMVKQDEKA